MLPPDITRAETLDKAHGRIETRRIAVSAEVVEHLEWLGAAQVARIWRERRIGDTVSTEVAYFVTSLPASKAGPDRLLALVRAHWGIESRLHHVRDVSMDEDRCRVRAGGREAMQPKPDPDKPPTAMRNVRVGADMRIEEITREQCLKMTDRVWAVVSQSGKPGVECISYVASPKAQGAETAVVFFQGDVPSKDIADASQDKAREEYQRLVDRRASQLDMPVVVIGRPGVMGSSGFHINGGQRDEGQIMDVALERIKERLGIRRLALAGQSGGARIVAQLLVIGRTDIACTAMGSGAYNVPQLVGGSRAMTNIWGNPGERFLVPMLRAAEIPPSASRRNFVIGDPRDKVAGFGEQRAWADTLASLNHHAVLIETVGNGEEFHGTSEKSMRAAALCAQGRSDAEIRAAVMAKE